MNQDVFETQVTKLLQLHAPVKARQLATILKDEIGSHRFFKLKETPQLLGWWGEEIAWLFVKERRCK